MSFKLGNTTIGELYVGSNKIAQAYLGSNLVYQATAPGPSFDEVTIGTQTWMAKNLAIDDGGTGITIVDNVTANGVNFGTQYYYTFDAAVRVAASISGWHLPTQAEWTTLGNTAGGANNAGTKLKSTTGWNSGNGTDYYGFTVLPAGVYYNGSTSYVGSRAFFRVYESGDSTYATYCTFTTGKSMDLSNSLKAIYYSVRLIKD